MAAGKPLVRMAVRRRLRRILRALPLAAVVAVLLAALYLVASVEQETGQLGRLSLVIFLLTGVALITLVAVIVWRLVRLVRRVRGGEPGARLSARLVTVFVALALPPVVVVYLFSLEFLSSTIEGWMDVGTEPALADSIELGQLFLDLRTRQARDQLAGIAAAVPADDGDDLRFRYLLRRVSSAGPEELAVLNPSGRVLEMVHIDPSRLVADLPSDFALSQAARGQEYAAAEPLADGRLQIRVLLPVPGAGPGTQPTLLQGIFPLPETFSGLAEGIERAYFRHENVAYLRDRLQQSFVLILSLVLLITALLAMLLAFNAARRLVAPVRELAEATESMSAGEFPDQLPVSSRDELGFLVTSFNTMTRQLAASQRQLEAQRHYLETVLGRLSAGVIAIDGRRCLSAHNASAGKILDLDLQRFDGQPLVAIAAERPELSPLIDTIINRAAGPGREWRREIRLDGEQHTLALVCRGSSLPDESDAGRTGHVVVFDDVTVLDQAQREAAWAELARRLAHEVKNPLTPIRLAAERLRLRFDSHAGGQTSNGELVTRTTDTIINQVDALRRLVDAFGDYARPPPPRLDPEPVDPLVREVVDLYDTAGSGIRFELNLDAGDEHPRIEPGRIRQVLHNLIRNAQEAHPESSPRIRISTGQTADAAGDWLELAVADDGPGFAPEVLARLFEPYVTTKQRGTGLGLAIVARIIDEHGGHIKAGNRPHGGAEVRIRLPLARTRSSTETATQLPM